MKPPSPLPLVTSLSTDYTRLWGGVFGRLVFSFIRWNLITLVEREGWEREGEREGERKNGGGRASERGREREGERERKSERRERDQVPRLNLKSLILASTRPPSQSPLVKSKPPFTPTPIHSTLLTKI